MLADWAEKKKDGGGTCPHLSLNTKARRWLANMGATRPPASSVASALGFCKNTRHWVARAGPFTTPWELSLGGGFGPIKALKRGQTRPGESINHARVVCLIAKA